MVIRDLTLRSAASFGSFHLIRLLYDEYMYYLIEHRVAQAKGETPIAVMGEVQPHPQTHQHGKQVCDVWTVITHNLLWLQFASLGRGLRQMDPDKGNLCVSAVSSSECSLISSTVVDSFSSFVSFQKRRRKRRRRVMTKDRSCPFHQMERCLEKSPWNHRLSWPEQTRGSSSQADQLTTDHSNT